MIPVTQTLFGDKEGNCFAACIASILHLELTEVPNFCAAPDTWWDDVNRWLSDRYQLFLFCYNVADENADRLRSNVPPPFHSAFTILSGPNPRGLRHSCVGKGLELVHDPNPSREGLLRVDQVDVFVSMRPHLMPQQGIKCGQSGMFSISLDKPSALP